jgi:hypothetical protein
MQGTTAGHLPLTDTLEAKLSPSQAGPSIIRRIRGLRLYAATSNLGAVTTAATLLNPTMPAKCSGNGTKPSHYPQHHKKAGKAGRKPLGLPAATSLREACPPRDRFRSKYPCTHQTGPRCVSAVRSADARLNQKDRTYVQVLRNLIRQRSRHHRAQTP